MTHITLTTLLTPREVAETFGCSLRKLERDRTAGGGPPFIKIGALVRYPADTLDQWLRARVRSSTSDVTPRVSAR